MKYRIITQFNSVQSAEWNYPDANETNTGKFVTLKIQFLYALTEVLI